MANTYSILNFIFQIEYVKCNGTDAVCNVRQVAQSPPALYCRRDTLATGTVCRRGTVVVAQSLPALYCRRGTVAIGSVLSPVAVALSPQALYFRLAFELLRICVALSAGIFDEIRVHFLQSADA